MKSTSLIRQSAIASLLTVCSLSHSALALDRNANKQTISTSTIKVAQVAKNAATTKERTQVLSLESVLESQLTVEEVFTQPCDQRPVNSGEASARQQAGFIICGPQSSPDHDYGYSDSSDEADSETEDTAQAYDLFEPYANDFSLINAGLLADASLYSYTPSGVDSEDFADWFAAQMQNFGMQVVLPINDSSTDTQGAVMINDDIVIVTFRGTTTNMADFGTDLNVTMTRMNDWDEDDLPIYVHSGFIGAVDAIVDNVVASVAQHAPGRQVWVTGHSLGGAIASLVAYQLHAVEGIDVQGVYTYGSPMVGDSGWAQAYDDADLEDRTWRFEIGGDPIPHYFPKGATTICGNITVRFWIWTRTVYSCNIPALFDFEHVGITKQIEAQWDGDAFNYNILEDQGDVPRMMPTLTGALVEHVKYDNAIRSVISETADADITDILPPLLTDGCDYLMF